MGRHLRAVVRLPQVTAGGDGGSECQSPLAGLAIRAAMEARLSREQHRRKPATTYSIPRMTT